MYFSTLTMTLYALCATLSATQPTPVDKRMDCGPSSQYCKPDANCVNTLYTPGGGHGGYGCGPASQYYKPGPHCENTLYTNGDSGSNTTDTTSSPTGGSTPGCGPASQWYKPGPDCENTLYNS